MPNCVNLLTDNLSATLVYYMWLAMFISTNFVFFADVGLTFHAVLHVLSCVTFVPLLSMATSSAKSKSCIT